MGQIAILTIVFLAGAIIGFHFLEESHWFKTFLYLLGGVIWYGLTYVWWAHKILDKFFK